jgi:hypothetical protein
MQQRRDRFVMGDGDDHGGECCGGNLYLNEDIVFGHDCGSYSGSGE